MSLIARVLITASKEAQRTGFQDFSDFTASYFDFFLSQTSLSNRPVCYCAHLTPSQGIRMVQEPFLTSLQGFPQLSPQTYQLLLLN